MKNVWSIICEKSSVDSQSNLLSLFNCIEEMKLEIDKTKMPKSDKLVVPVNLQFISLWSIDDYAKANSADIKVEFIDPRGKVLNEFTHTLKSKKGDKRLRSIMNIQGMQITENGRYYYRMFKKRENKFDLISEVPLDVSLGYKKL